MAMVETKTETTVNGMSLWKYHAANGREIAATMDETDEYRVIKAVMIHTLITTKNVQGAQAINTPAVVAIPFPPLNLIQKEKLCPKMAEIPEIKIGIFEYNSSAAPVLFWK
jgi:hypothetical protein